MNHLYYVEHHSMPTKNCLHEKGYYTAEEVLDLMASGKYIFRKAKVTATCKGKEVEIRRKTRFARTRFGKRCVGVESVE